MVWSPARAGMSKLERHGEMGRCTRFVGFIFLWSPFIYARCIRDRVMTHFIMSLNDIYCIVIHTHSTMPYHV